MERLMVNRHATICTARKMEFICVAFSINRQSANHRALLSISGAPERFKDQPRGCSLVSLRIWESIIRVGCLVQGCWMLDVGFKIQDSRSWIQDPGFKILDSRSWIQDSGFKMLDAGFKILDAGFRIQDSGIQRLGFEWALIRRAIFWSAGTCHRFHFRMPQTSR